MPSDAAFPDPATFRRATVWLQQARLRPTRQRRALAALLKAGGQRHVTAEMLFEEAQAAGIDVSLATVYNTLRLFTGAAMLREIHIDASRAYYDTRTEEHAHFYDVDTGELMDAPAGSVRFASLPSPPDGRRIEAIDVVLRVRGAGSPDDR